jgi:hypothetical protein
VKKARKIVPWFTLSYASRMTNSFRFILTLVFLYAARFADAQSTYSDLVAHGLHGKVKSVSTTTIEYDSLHWGFGFDQIEVNAYNLHGNCTSEWEYWDTVLVLTSVHCYQNASGGERRVRKITAHGADTVDKTITSYFPDDTGFDTSIVVCNLDSNYYFRYVYEKNDRGLRIRATEFDGASGAMQNSYEVFYTDKSTIDSIIYRDAHGLIDFIEYDFYNAQGEVEIMKFSDRATIRFVYNARDAYGNWTERDLYQEEDEDAILRTRQRRTIAYYE